VLIARLRDGQRLTVLQLPALPMAGIEANELKRASFVVSLADPI
jgi:hypothetical protein